MTTPLTRAEAGRLGGLKTRRKYGKEHFEKIGRKGGKARGRKVLIAKTDKALRSIFPA